LCERGLRWSRHDYLYACASDKIFRRKTQAKGVLFFQPRQQRSRRSSGIGRADRAMESTDKHKSIMKGILLALAFALAKRNPLVTRRLTSSVLLGALFCLVTGCASIVTGIHRKVTFKSTPEAQWSPW